MFKNHFFKDFQIICIIFTSHKALYTIKIFYYPQMSLASTSSEQSPEPLFDLQDLHGQAALHVAARLGQAQVVKVSIIFSSLY